MKSILSLLLLLSALIPLAIAQRISKPNSHGNTIYSNFGTGTHRYYPSGLVMMPGHGEAVPFTPLNDARVTAVAVSVLHEGGQNEITLSLNDDSNNSPGTPLYTWTLINVPDGGSPCCTRVAFAINPTGIRVTAGQRYWIVAEAIGDSTDYWAVTYPFLTGEFAYTCPGAGCWTVVTEFGVPGFAVFGEQKP